MFILFQHLSRDLQPLFRTTSRIQTFYDGAPNSPLGVCHIPMEPAYCPSTSQVVSESAKTLGLKLHPAVTCVTIEGPRFSSLAESKMYRSLGGDVINMTSVPEVMH
jgi:5'-methylthioadenosine phosphorylase